MNGDDAAWRLMERYNKQDVVLLEKLYYRMMPWIDEHPNAALYMPNTDILKCTNCGSEQVHKRGIQATRTHQYQRYRCDDCKTWMRSRYTLLKRSQVLTQIGA
jgi:predicted SprT family Zn-dependent metalloprotease